MPPTRLDESSSNSSESEDLDGYEFDGLDSGSNTPKIKCLSKTDLSNVLEDNKEDNEDNEATKDEYSFGFSGGYSMKKAQEVSAETLAEAEANSLFNKGYKMELQ
mmetsp:Transcript_17304/g.19367  ORF Transcript_17304/g.19367 Transcript_17304/m.19367 type:complete len:105 (+) Transcript_17304:138-452(+)